MSGHSPNGSELEEPPTNLTSRDSLRESNGDRVPGNNPSRQSPTSVGTPAPIGTPLMAGLFAPPRENPWATPSPARPAGRAFGEGVDLRAIWERPAPALPPSPPPTQSPHRPGGPPAVPPPTPTRNSGAIDREGSVRRFRAAGYVGSRPGHPSPVPYFGPEILGGLRGNRPGMQGPPPPSPFTSRIPNDNFLDVPAPPPDLMDGGFGGLRPETQAPPPPPPPPPRTPENHLPDAPAYSPAPPTYVDGRGNIPELHGDDALPRPPHRSARFPGYGFWPHPNEGGFANNGRGNRSRSAPLHNAARPPPNFGLPPQEVHGNEGQGTPRPGFDLLPHMIANAGNSLPEIRLPDPFPPPAVAPLPENHDGNDSNGNGNGNGNGNSNNAREGGAGGGIGNDPNDLLATIAHNTSLLQHPLHAIQSATADTRDLLNTTIRNLELLRDTHIIGTDRAQDALVGFLAAVLQQAASARHTTEMLAWRERGAVWVWGRVRRVWGEERGRVAVVVGVVGVVVFWVWRWMTAVSGLGNEELEGLLGAAVESARESEVAVDLSREASEVVVRALERADVVMKMLEEFVASYALIYEQGSRVYGLS
jgi:hypothetical protein